MLNGMAYNEKVDVWAIGVIAYQLLFGKLPFYS
jgi:serine/threonine protein kinase